MILKEKFHHLSSTVPIALLFAVGLGGLFSGEPARGSTGTTGGSVGYNAVNYFFLPTPNHQPLFQSVQLQGSIRGDSPSFEGVASGQAMVLITPQAEPFFESPELYAGTSRQASEVVQVHIGRKLESWSQLDDQWRLGLFQPRFRWDYFHPEPVGLTGLFATLNVAQVRVVGFASLLHVPERGVPIAVNNGAFESPTPWFIAPSSKITLFERETTIRYKLDVPPMHSLVFNNSMGAIARVGAAEGVWGSAAYTWKPINQLFLGHSAYLSLDDISATIRPRILYHHLAALDAGYKTRDLGVTVSTVYEKPLETPVPGNWTVQTAKPALAASTSAFVLVGPERRPTRLDFGYLRRLGGNAPDVGRDANGASSIFEPRYPYTSAIRMGGSSQLRTIRLSSHVIYDAAADGALWQSEFRLQPRQQWSVRLGADLLATDVFGNARSGEDSLIVRYKMNNRVHAGVSYVF